MKIIEPNDWPTLRDALPAVSFLLNPLIPAGSTTFVHGPPGCGKSAFAWGAANAIVAGEPYLGLETSKASCLLISTDMNLYQFKIRWGTDAFEPLFPFLVIPKCDITRPNFAKTELWKNVQAYVLEKRISAVFFDALGGLHAGKSARDDETATMVDATLNAWLPGVAKVLLGHDRKLRPEESEPDDEGFNGSQLWRANTTSQVHIWRSGNHKSTLRHSKSQVSDTLAQNLHLYIDIAGKAELWQEKRAQEVIQKTNVALRGMIGLEKKEQVLILMQTHKISERTAWRWLSLAKG
jgi:AAA domain